MQSSRGSFQGVGMAVRPSLLTVGVAAFASLVLVGCTSTSKTGTLAGPSTSAAATTTPATGSSASPSPTATKTKAAASDKNFNSCSIVTQAEAASAIGESVTAGVLGSATVEGGLACVFYGPSAISPKDPNVAQPDSVRVVLVKGSDATRWYNDYHSKVPARSISGYGDQAFYDGAASLSVLKGQDYLRIAISPAGAPPSLKDEEALASAILPNL